MEKLRMIDKKRMTQLVLILSAVFLVGIYVYDANKQDNIKENLGITACMITNVHSGYRGGIQIGYTFNYEGKTYTGGSKYLISNAYADKFLNYRFPVAFDKSNPSQNAILLLPADFNEFNLSYPDSLEWVCILKEKSL